MEKNNFARWDHRYVVDIPFIDTQHRNLVALINDLYQAGKDNSAEAKLGYAIAVKRAVYCSMRIFSTEERIMDSTNYPNIEKHKQEHANFIRTVLDGIKAFESGGHFNPDRFVLFFRDRILAHFIMMDAELGRYVQNLKKNKFQRRRQLRSMLNRSFQGEGRIFENLV